jgi:WD40 repeat protein
MVLSLLFNSSEDLLVSAGEDEITRLWDPNRARQFVAAPGFAVAFRGDGQRLAFRRGVQLGVWDVFLSEVCRTIVHAADAADQWATDYGGPWGLAFSPDARVLASCGGDGVRLWDPVNGQERARLPTGRTDAVLFHPDGTHLLSYGEQGLHSWTLAPDRATLISGDRPRLLVAPTSLYRWTHICCLSSDGRSLALIANKEKRLIELRPFDGSGTGIVLEGPPTRVHSLAMSADGRWLAAGAPGPYGIPVWDAGTGQKVTDLSGSRIGDGVAFSPDSRHLVAGGLSEYRFWHVGDWAPGLVIKRDHRETRPGVMAFSRDGTVLALAWSRQLVRLVDTTSGQELATLTAPDHQPISRICFSPDDSQLAVATENQLIHLWDLRQLRRGLKLLGLDWGKPALAFPPGTLSGRRGASRE